MDSEELLTRLCYSIHQLLKHKNAAKLKKNPAKSNHLSAEDACRAMSPFLSASLDELRHFSALLFIVSTVGMETRQGNSTEVARLHYFFFPLHLMMIYN